MWNSPPPGLWQVHLKPTGFLVGGTIVTIASGILMADIKQIQELQAILLKDFFQKTAMRLHECDIRHLEESGKRQAEANTWETVGFPVDGKNVLKSVTKKPHENFSNRACVK